MIFDDPDIINPLEIRSVVVATEKTPVSRAEKRHYVLLVTLAKGGPNVYERAGVGFMLGSYIDFEQPPVPGRIR